jgi:hypothetical protein
VGGWWGGGKGSKRRRGDGRRQVGCGTFCCWQSVMQEHSALKSKQRVGGWLSKPHRTPTPVVQGDVGEGTVNDLWRQFRRHPITLPPQPRQAFIPPHQLTTHGSPLQVACGAALGVLACASLRAVAATCPGTSATVTASTSSSTGRDACVDSKQELVCGDVFVFVVFCRGVSRCVFFLFCFF